jgi:RNA polymerase sigma factor (TIGR02999 family)
MSEVTHILHAIAAGDPRAAGQLLPLVYDELRRLAAHLLAHQAPGQTLQATALVHEAYLRLLDGGQPQGWNGRGHFFAATAEAMRRILVERARHKQSLNAGGGRRRPELPDVELAVAGPRLDLLALHEALTKLEQHDPRRAELVKLRFFAGLTIAEAARVRASPPRRPTTIGPTPARGSAWKSRGAPAATASRKGRVGRSRRGCHGRAEA